MTYNFTTLISFYLLTEINITCGATFFTSSRQNIGTEYIMKCVQQILLCEREPKIIHFTKLIDKDLWMKGMILEPLLSFMILIPYTHIKLVNH